MSHYIMVRRALYKTLRSIVLRDVRLTQSLICRHLGVFRFSLLQNSIAMDVPVLVCTWAWGQGESTFLRLWTPSRWLSPRALPQAAVPCTCCFQVEHDAPHGERLLLAHQERDCVSGRNPAGPVLHPLFTQVGCPWCSRPLSSPAPQQTPSPAQRPTADHTVEPVSLSALCPADPRSFPQGLRRENLGGCRGGADGGACTSDSVVEQSQLGSGEGWGRCLGKEIRTASLCCPGGPGQ